MVVVELLLDPLDPQSSRLLLSLLMLTLLLKLSIDHSLFLDILQCKHSCMSRQPEYMCLHWDMDLRNRGRRWLFWDPRQSKYIIKCRSKNMSHIICIIWRIGYIWGWFMLIWSLTIVTTCTSLTIAFKSSGECYTQSSIQAWTWPASIIWCYLKVSKYKLEV